MNPNFNFHLSAPIPSHSQSAQPVPATSPTQSVPGRRTPLGTVGIGGFYAQSQHQTDENLPSGSRERFEYSFYYSI